MRRSPGRLPEFEPEQFVKTITRARRGQPTLAARGESWRKIHREKRGWDRTLRTMAMGKRKSEQAPMWIPTTDLPVSPGHPFYTPLNAILNHAGFDRFAHAHCQAFSPPR